MEAFLSRKRRRLSPAGTTTQTYDNSFKPVPLPVEDDSNSTELKLATLASLHPQLDHNLLLDFLLANDGCVEQASSALSNPPPSRKRPDASLAYQSSISTFTSTPNSIAKTLHPSKPLTKKGQTLHLYTPSQISAHTPCTLIPNFLPISLANTLLTSLLSECTTFTSATFKLFDTVVTSPHTACFYLPASTLANGSSYLYNGTALSDIRAMTPSMLDIQPLIRTAVNDAIRTRIRTHYPNGERLPHQSSKAWEPNAAFVNCYDGGTEAVGYHADQLTYLGPRPVIGSLSLGVAREFRVRRVIPSTDAQAPNEDDPDSKQAKADAQGQIAIHLPHNSLLIMHADMQEEWKHAISPAKTIEPHPLAGSKRINITYRHYRDSFAPRWIPQCACNAPTVLRPVMRKKDAEGRGKYFWGCQMGSRLDNAPSKDSLADKPSSGCGYFEWAVFNDDGEPIWKPDRRTTDKA